MSNELPDIVKRAMVGTVTSIGQLTEQERRTLERYVKRGYLSKGLGGPFPRLKTVYAHPDFDFTVHRQRHVDHMMRLCELDREAAAQRASNQHHERKGGEVVR